jgi:dihydrofolate synthase/folylpolyglutamate synthase
VTVLAQVHDEKFELSSLDDLVAELEGLLGVAFWSAETNLKLQRIQWLVDAVGSPHAGLPHVHVGGTSGKGSVAAATASILSAHGQRVGLHLSPYVQTLNETWQIDGRNVKPSVALAVARRLSAAFRGTEPPPPHGLPSYFEFKVALAFLLFRQVEVDRAVVEVGLGGTLDATNVLGSGVKVLTNVGLDHTEVLGDTVEEIARDKIGIMKPGSVVVSGATQPAVRKLVQEHCEHLNLRLLMLDETLGVERVGPRRLVVRMDDEPDISVSIPGTWRRHQEVNAGLAIAAARLSLEERLEPQACAEALQRVRLPGRVEVFTGSAGVTVLDGAHNEDKLRAALACIESMFPGRKLVGVVAVKAGKDLTAVTEILAAHLAAAVFTTFHAPPWTCEDPDGLAGRARDAGVSAVETSTDAESALDRARELAGSQGIVVVTGSFYLVGNLRHRWVSDEEAALRGGSY